MTRDELLLAALAAGDASTAALAHSNGLSERTCRYGLAHLVKAGYVWSPERGRWRLTEAGRTMAASLNEPSPAGPTEAEAEDLPTPTAAAVAGSVALPRAGSAPRPQAASEVPTGEQPGRPRTGEWNVPGWLGWGFAAIAAGVVALAYRATLPAAAGSTVPSPAAIPNGWPYNGWQSWQG